MNFDECVNFLTDLQEEMIRLNGKVRSCPPARDRRRVRVVWIGPLAHIQGVRLAALGNVFGVELRAITTTQDIRRFRGKLLEARASEAMFLWESRCENMGGIARSTFQAIPTELCQEWEWDDMFLSLRLWLQQGADEFAAFHNVDIIAPELIHRRLGESRVLCISPQNRPNIKDVLRRSGFPAVAIDAIFHEEKIEFGENSNMMQTLEGRGDSYRFLLYVWEGLRHTSSAVEQKFGKNLFKGRTARSVVDQFRRYVLAGQDRT